MPQPDAAAESTRAGEGAPSETPAGEGLPTEGIAQAVQDRDFGALAAEAWRFVTMLWNAELFKAGDTAVTINQLVIALLVVLIGAVVSRRLTRLIQHRLMRSRRVDQHAAALVQKLLFYLMLAVIVLVALPIAGIPITIFTVLGGALAIGIGFGAQNLINNLISGLIIMTERPIRLGDLVEVADYQGRVEEIGNRCTRIRRPDGVDVLVPNSHFLEQPVINWTLFDNTVRGSVVVGVAYGSPTREVEELMRQAVAEQDKAMTDPEPIVLFEDFGDNALTFNVLFWTAVTRPMDLRRLQSDVRYRIDQLLREAKITIAFPQRDVHLDTLSPLRVQLTGDHPRTTDDPNANKDSEG